MIDEDLVIGGLDERDRRWRGGSVRVDEERTGIREVGVDHPIEP